MNKHAVVKARKTLFALSLAAALPVAVHSASDPLTVNLGFSGSADDTRNCSIDTAPNRSKTLSFAFDNTAPISPAPQDFTILCEGNVLANQTVTFQLKNAKGLPVNNSRVPITVKPTGGDPVVELVEIAAREGTGAAKPADGLVTSVNNAAGGKTFSVVPKRLSSGVAGAISGGATLTLTFADATQYPLSTLVTALAGPSGVVPSVIAAAQAVAPPSDPSGVPTFLTQVQGVANAAMAAPGTIPDANRQDVERALGTSVLLPNPPTVDPANPAATVTQLQAVGDSLQPIGRSVIRSATDIPLGVANSAIPGGSAIQTAGTTARNNILSQANATAPPTPVIGTPPLPAAPTTIPPDAPDGAAQQAYVTATQEAITNYVTASPGTLGAYAGTLPAKGTTLATTVIGTPGQVAGVLTGGLAPDAMQDINFLYMAITGAAPAGPP